MTEKIQAPTISFESAAAWREWLGLHHADTVGVWLRIYKKGRGISVTYAEALDEALCFGWIDGQKKTYDEDSYIQKFTPRRAGSLWSKRNVEFISRLRRQGRMAPSGEAEVAAAQADGRWEKAYDSPSQATVPADFSAALQKLPKAQAFFETLNKTNRYAIIWRLQTAKKEETRQRRMQHILDMLARGEKFH